MSPKNVIVLSLLILSFSYFSWNVWKKWCLLKLLKPDDPITGFSSRFSRFTQDVIGQRKLFREMVPGLQHALIFWGFLVVSIATLEQFISGVLPNGFRFSFLGVVYAELVVVTDVTYAIILLAVLLGIYRRLIQRPARLETSVAGKVDAVLILLLIAVLMVAGLLMGAVETRQGASWIRPIGWFLAELLESVPEDKLALIYGAAWWVHLIGVLGFLVYLPHSKHFHIIAAAPNVFFARFRHPGQLRKTNLDDESITEFGALKLENFTWKDILDSYACTECGRCNEYCPTASTGKALHPKDLIKKIRNHAEQKGEALIRKELALKRNKKVSPKDQEVLSKSLIGDVLSTEEIWDCTSCRACSEACPVSIEHADKIIEMRRGVVLMEGRNPDEATTLFKNLESSSNPWGMDPSSRQEWLLEKGVERFNRDRHEYLYYIGCAGSFDDRNKKVVDSVIKILRAANVRFGILGPDERCTGDSARRLGNEYLAQSMIKENVELLNGRFVTKIISSCPHCYNTLKHEYPQFGGEFAVISHVVLIQQLIRGKRISPKPSSLGAMTYHDSCYLGRYNNIYDSQREIIRLLNPGEFLELPRSRERGLCCGAGGGRMWLDEKSDERINVHRIDEVLASGAKTVASACPFCMTMLEDGLKKRDQTEACRVRDVAELVADLL